MIAVEVCSRTLSYPRECPCCGCEPDGDLAIPLRASSRPIADDTEPRLRVPYCRQCVEHVATWETASAASSVLILVGIVAAIGIGLSGTSHGPWILCGAIVLAALVGSTMQARARARCTPTCACAGRAIAYYGRSGRTSMLGFASSTYTALFTEANPSEHTVIRTRSVPAARRVARSRQLTGASTGPAPRACGSRSAPPR